jgi:hypothetical protein
LCVKNPPRGRRGGFFVSRLELNMERTYEFEKNAYRNKVLLINWLLVPLLAYCLYRLFGVGTNRVLWALLAVVCVYGLTNSLLRKSNPRTITVSDDEIVFASFGEKRFEVNKLTKFRVKVVTPNYQIVVWVEDSDRRRGTFWVPYSQFNDKLDLLAEFDYLEKKVHPGSLRFRGRETQGAARPAVNNAGTDAEKAPEGEPVNL